MIIKVNTKFRNIVSYVEKEMQKQNARRIIFYGVGEASEKCISCVEYFKGRYTKNTGETLYQWSILQQAVATDVWKPDDEQMRTLKVEMRVPAMFIMISRDPFLEQYQCPSIQSTAEEYPSFLKKQKRGPDPRKSRNQAHQKKSREDGGSSNPWRRPEKPKLGGKGSKKRKTNSIGDSNAEKQSSTPQLNANISTIE
uniref:DNA/RNA-binding protein Alba-like domain-containing protein n=1 Tax=Acrobeloides nanus TaxID=290746 RepID=A0A914EF26_9BILA